MAEEGGEKKQEEVKRHTYPLIRVRIHLNKHLVQTGQTLEVQC